MVQLEEVSSRRVHTGRHANLKHQPTMMFSALPPDAVMATLSIGSPARVSTSGDTSHPLAGARHSGSASNQQGSVALLEAAIPTPAMAARVSTAASSQGAAAALSEHDSLTNGSST